MTKKITQIIIGCITLIAVVVAQPGSMIGYNRLIKVAHVTSALPRHIHTYIHTNLYSAENRENESDALALDD